MRLRALFVFLLLAAQFVHGQDSSKLKEIVESFYSSYNLWDQSYPHVRFEKKLDKWYVSTLKVENGAAVPVRTFLYYDPAGYKKLPFDRASGDTVNYRQYIDSWSEFNYNLHPFFGYEAWYKDVIDLYSKKEKLSDDQLYSLARSYSAYAGSLMVDQRGDGDKKDLFNCRFTTNCLTAAQISKYNAIIEEAQKNYALLAKRNPKYKTAVGPIAVKYANEHVVQFHTMLTFAEKYSRGMRLPENIFSDSALKKWSEAIDSCPQGAVLFTFGDTDFYPLLYLQQQRKLRKDVYVINYSLIGLDAFIYRATQPQFESKGITLSMDTTAYAGEENAIVFIEDSLEVMSFGAVAERIRSGALNESGYRTIPTKLITLRGAVDGLSGLYVICEIDSKYLFKNQWILLDMIHNLGKRKMCFTDLFDDELEGLNKLLDKKGSIWMYRN